MCKYQIEIQDDKSILRSQSGEYIADIERANSSLPYLFFKRNNKEYLIYSESLTKQIVFNCSIGHFTEHSSLDGFIWDKLKQVDESKFRVWNEQGNSRIYDFINWTSNEEIQVVN